jgi:hypothetical protein
MQFLNEIWFEGLGKNTFTKMVLSLRGMLHVFALKMFNTSPYTQTDTIQGEQRFMMSSCNQNDAIRPGVQHPHVLTRDCMHIRYRN